MSSLVLKGGNEYSQCLEGMAHHNLGRRSREKKERGRGEGGLKIVHLKGREAVSYGGEGEGKIRLQTCAETCREYFTFNQVEDRHTLAVDA